MNYATCATTANPDNVRHHVRHGDGRSSYKVTGDYDDVTVYLDGTPIEIKRFAAALLNAANAQERIERAMFGDPVGGGG